jgi:hypothetical protein
MSKIILNNINSSKYGYQQLIDLYNQYKEDFFETIKISFTDWFGANFCSPLGGILDKLSTDRLHIILFENIPNDIKTIIQKNDFLSYFGFERLPDTNSTTIKYLKLKPSDGRFFHGYVVDELLNRRELPGMSGELKKKITESIYEIFINAQMHSGSEFIYTCGQFFPKKQVIEFTITDTGVGFEKKISERFNVIISAAQAIKWAIIDGNSTKSGISGGIGLAILKEFIAKNNGKFQIVSNDGFYHFDANNEYSDSFDGRFPGTIINMQFRTDDLTSYNLDSDSVISTDDIF